MEHVSVGVDCRPIGYAALCISNLCFCLLSLPLLQITRSRAQEKSLLPRSCSEDFRFNIAANLVDEAKDAGKLGFAGILVWLRFVATRQLIWNKNYNVKPREISKAQDRLTDLLQNVYKSHPQYQELLRMVMSSVGRGGEGDVGQRIRDEILVIQGWNKALSMSKNGDSHWALYAKSVLDRTRLVVALLAVAPVVALLAAALVVACSQVVKGLGETLVGAYPGRALSFMCKKNDLNSPQVLGYPSKPIGLFIRRSIIFRSDSNGEDLEGYAGADFMIVYQWMKKKELYLITHLTH